MSLSDLISLKGLVTVSVASIISVKAIHLTWKVTKNNVSIKGDNNNVNIVNQELAAAQRGFKLLWNLLVVLTALTYPMWGEAYNSILATAAYFGVPLSIIALVAVISGSGWKRIWDAFYVIGVGATCWLVACAAPYLPSTAQYAGAFGALVRTLKEYGVGGIVASQSANAYMDALMRCTSGLFGFVLLFLSFGFLLFSFLEERSFDDALRRVVTYTGVCALGYLLVGGLLFDHDPGHLATLVSAAFPVSFN
ncbi:hypothetical protein [Trinickia mobilis]|uniref:hypothetical protein n=1 Tax=Trinickia mobilis TaxID=2816356 RepID=UPI001A8FCA6B|nr:hypothetical protein [Trinickia mobilis]